MNRKISFALLSLLVVCGAFGFADEILEKLGLRDPRYIVLNNMIESYIDPNCSSGCDRMKVPHPGKLADIIQGDKKALARESCEWLKAYCQSAEFNTAYQKQRLSRKPFNEKAVDIDGQSQDTYKELIAQAKTSLKTAGTAAEKDNWKKMIAQYEYMLAKGSQAYPMTWEWENKYPASADSLVIRGLKRYLYEQSTVDFNAQLITRGKVKIFANPEYEKKPASWKAIFRSGKEVNDIAKAFVNDWLKEGVHVSTEGYVAPEEKKNEEKPAATDEVKNTTVDKSTEKTEKKSGGLLKKIKKVLD